MLRYQHNSGRQNYSYYYPGAYYEACDLATAEFIHIQDQISKPKLI